MERGTIQCGGCEKVIAYFPADNPPKSELELYCEGCMDNLEDETDLKEELNGQN